MPTTPTLTLCDKLVSELIAAWEPSGDDVVERVYYAPMTLDKTTGRKVYIFPATYGSDPADRGHDQYTHDIIVLVARHYPDDSLPPTEWVDEEVDFVHEFIFEGLDYSTDGPLRWGSGSDARSVLTQSIGPVDVYDAVQLTKAYTFWTEVPIQLIEIL